MFSRGFKDIIKKTAKFKRSFQALKINFKIQGNQRHRGTLPVERYFSGNIIHFCNLFPIRTWHIKFSVSTISCNIVLLLSVLLSPSCFWITSLHLGVGLSVSTHYYLPCSHYYLPQSLSPCCSVLCSKSCPAFFSAHVSLPCITFYNDSVIFSFHFPHNYVTRSQPSFSRIAEPSCSNFSTCFSLSFFLSDLCFYSTSRMYTTTYVTRLSMLASFTG